MKQFIVLQKIGVFNATVVRDFNDKKDAKDYAKLMQKSEESNCITYYVAEVQTNEGKE